ncbi:leucine-rich repeat protein [Eubacterium limosum]|uniref:leucine-rich repeat protein n=1 Tax=Eubacterium limosum TaxID=1736 RepID=UPI0022E87B12|nr:leucine-rich repeat protein [Eubacterium limosum]
MDVAVKKFRGAGVLKTALLLLAALLGLLAFGAGTARAEEGAVVYGLYETDNKVYACDATGKQTEPAAEIDKNTVTNLFVADGVKKLRDYAFLFSGALKEVTMPDTVTEIGVNAFYRSGLTNITLSEGLTKIGDEAFSECEGLKEVTLPGTVADIGIRAFNKSGLEIITLSEGLTKLGSEMFKDCQALKTITLPNSITEIGSGAFSNTGLETITLPAGLTKLDRAVFSGCQALKTITLPAGLTKLERDVFNGCQALKTITLPNSITEIGNDALRNTGLEIITLPEGLTKIAVCTFTDCKALKEVTIPDTVTEIGWNAFGNSGLETITLPAGLTKLEHDAFNGCQMLKTITLPENLKTIDYLGFANCTNLTRIVLSSATPPTVSDNVFANTPSSRYMVLTGAAATSDEYDGGWEGFTKTKALGTDVTPSITDQTYTGSALEPGIPGTKDIDYKVTYENNTNVGAAATAHITTDGCYGMYTGSADINFTITPAPLTIEGLSAQSRPYDGSTAVTLTGGSLKGIIGSEDVSIAMPVEGTVADANKGTEKPVTYTLPALQGSQKDNYSLTAPELKANITAAPLTIEGLSAQSRPYDGSTAVTLTGGSLKGIIGSEDVSIAMPVEGTVADANKGTEKPVTYTLPALQGSQKDNYSLTAPELKANITAAPLTIEGLSAQSRPYDGSTAVTLTGGSLKGIIGNEDVSIAMPVEGTVADASKGTGKAVTYTPPELQGSDKGNYSLTVPEVKADITPAPLTLAGGAIAAKTYDGTTGTAVESVSFAGLQNNEALIKDTDYTAAAAFKDAAAGDDKAATLTVNLMANDKTANYTLEGSKTIAVKGNIAKATPAYELPKDRTAVYGQTLKDVTLPESFSWQDPEDTAVGNAGGNTFKVTYTPADPANYQTIADIEVSIEVSKATPVYELPKDRTAVYGQTLKDVALPEGFSWQDDESTAVGNAGSNTFKATYTPEDTANYQTVADIEVTIEVSKATPVYELPKDLIAVYGQTLKDVALPAGFSWQDDESTAVGNAGSNTFKSTYTPADTANYQSVADIEVRITVSKGESTLVVQADKTQFTYGEAFTLTVDVDLKPQSRSLTRAAADTVDFYLGDPADNRQLATAPVENSKATATIEKSNPNYPSGGSADITVVYNGSGSLNKSMGSLHLDITPAAGSAQVSQAGWTYGQTGASPVPVSETNGTENVTYAYKTKDAGDDTYQAEKPTNAGQYTLRATFAATQNYKAVTATADFAIEKAQPVLTIAPEAGKEIQVGDSITLNIAVKGVKDETPEGTVAILGKNLTLKDGQASIAYTPADTKPITLTATYTPAEGENYTSAEANTILTAGKKTRERITLSDLTKTYGDPAFTLTPTGGSLQAGESCQYASDNAAVATVDQNGEVTLHQAGTAHITVSVAESSAWNPAAATMTLTVDKAKITGVSFEDTAFTEDGAEHKIELTGSLPEGTSVSYENNVQKAPGTYTAKAIIDGGVNYESLELTAVLTITEKPADPTPVPPTPTPGTGSDTTSNPAPENTTNNTTENTTERTTENTNTGLAGSGTTAVAAVLLSLLALTGLVLWQKSKKQ